MIPRIPPDLILRMRSRGGWRCEYCHAPQIIIGPAKEKRATETYQQTKVVFNRVPHCWINLASRIAARTVPLILPNPLP